MSIVKSFSVGDGDMFYIRHGSDNFSIIDCCLSDDNKKEIVDEIYNESRNKNIVRFISTHPDEDHIAGLTYLDSRLNLLNFYCVENSATKDKVTTDFQKYCELRDDKEKAFNIYKDCKRRWMNQSGEDKDGVYRKHSGLYILWPDVNNKDYKDELKKANEGKSFNNISAIIQYNCGATFLWMGDLEKEMMEKIEDELQLPKAHILFAPHHGRSSGKIPSSLLDEINPEIIIVGEAPSEDLDYYQDYNTITQNSAGDIIFEIISKKIHIYVSNEDYSVDFLEDEDMSTYDYYIGTLDCN